MAQRASEGVSNCRRDRFWVRVRRVLGFRRDPERVCSNWYEEPLGAGVREPRRPRPFGPAGVMMLELPDTD